MSSYILLFHMPRDLVVAPEDRQSIYEAMVKWEADLEAAGHGLGSTPLHPADEAVNFSLEDGQPASKTGQHPDSKEVLVGSSTIRVDTLEAAVDIARQCPHLRCGRVELRQIRE